MSTDTGRSPLLGLADAVAGDGVDAGVAAHYGSFHVEQRRLEARQGFVDLSHREVVRVSGPERLTWLHNITTQYLLDVEPGTARWNLVLDPHGHVEHAFVGVDDGGDDDGTFTIHTEPGRAASLVDFLEKMKFLTRVEIADITAEVAVTWRPSRIAADGSAVDGFELVPRDQLEVYAEGAGPAAGLWAFEALRIARGEPRLGVDTDERTIPNEVGWIGSAVHLEKGCYRGQETVARVHNLGRPPRRLVLLHLDGSENRLPETGSPVHLGDRQVGFVGSSARHHELGPIALAVVKRNVPADADLAVHSGDTPMPAAQEVVVDPDVGLHVRRQ